MDLCKLRNTPQSEGTQFKKDLKTVRPYTVTFPIILFTIHKTSSPNTC